MAQPIPAKKPPPRFLGPPDQAGPPKTTPPAPPPIQIDNGAVGIQRPPGVPDTHHLMWVDHTVDPTTKRSLAMDLHQFYGPSGHVIPHGFAPVHARMVGNNSDKSPLPMPPTPQIKVPPISAGD